ncbi:MAG: AsmA-like C-terminal region-containing protein [Hyphomicrobium sp.]
MHKTARRNGEQQHVQTRAGEPASVPRRRLAAVASTCDNILHGLGRCVFILAPVIMLVVLALGLGYVRLRHGPISLNFMVAPIERGIAAELQGNTVEIDDAVVSLSEKGGLEFRLLNLRVLESDGNVVASAPLAAVELSTAALWSALIVPARVELIEPRLFLFYSDERGLSMSFSKPVEIAPDAKTPAGRRDATPGTTAKPPDAAAPPAQPAGPLKRIDLARVVTDMSARARQRLDASSFLSEVGLRNATVVLEYAGRTTEWRVPSVAVGLMHAKTRSVIAGRATIAGQGRRGTPWHVTFETDESESSPTLTLKTSIRGLVPRSLALAVPQLSLLQSFDMPIAGNATLELSDQGDILTAALRFEIGRGYLRLPALPDAPLEVDGGVFNVAYDGKTQRAELSQSTLRWRGSRVTLVGTLEHEERGSSRSAWRYQLKAIDGVLAADEFGITPVPLDWLEAKGRILPHRGEVELKAFNLKAGGAEVNLSGDFVAGVDPASTRLEGTLSPMPINTLKALWPKAIAPSAREWVGETMTRGQLLGGSFRFVSGEHMDAQNVSDGSAHHRLSMTLEAADLQFQVIKDTLPVEAPRATIRLENDGLEVNIPESAIVLGLDRRVPLKAARLTVVDIFGDAPVAEITFASEAPLDAVLEVLERSPLAFLQETGLPTEGLVGKVEGTYKITLPLVTDLQMSDIKVAGKSRISGGRANGLIGSYEILDASLNIDLTERAVDVNGEVLINGVPTKVGWQRIFDAPLDKQPPLRIWATLDNSDRDQLDLDINHIVQGEIPVEVTITKGLMDEPEIKLRADLTNADLVLENVAWRKRPGRKAILQTDIALGRTHKIELQNFKVAGDDVAIEGWMAIDADNRVREFYFPDFSLDVVTRLEMQGTLGSDGVWKVKARGPTFDGRNFFRSLFSLGQISESRPKPKNPRDGIDLEIEVGTVIGFSEVNLRNVKLLFSKRGEKLTMLDGRGTLDGGAQLLAVLEKKPNQPRMLVADSTDAGQAFRLIDFYPNVKGGRVRLKVNLDGKGPAEKTGILWVNKFEILGDAIVSEVFSGLDDGRPAIGNNRHRARRVVREVFEFDSMRVPFSVGYGQFVMKDSYVRGPLLGASFRGKVDFKTRRVNLGGTYVPLQGLNSAFCDIPIFGPILTGPKCEGLLGITFAIQGRMQNPQVIVNPFSMVAPGIFREIFQMTNPNPKVQPRNYDGASAGAKKKERASRGRASGGGTPTGSITTDGWSSQTIDGYRKN